MLIYRKYGAEMLVRSEFPITDGDWKINTLGTATPKTGFCMDMTYPPFNYKGKSAMIEVIKRYAYKHEDTELRKIWSHPKLECVKNLSGVHV